MYSRIFWGAQSRCYEFTSVPFHKITFKQCFSTQKTCIFLVLLCWKLFFVPCYYSSLNTNLDLLTLYLLRNKRVDYLTIYFIFLVGNLFPDLKLEGRENCILRSNYLSMGKKSLSSEKFMPQYLSRGSRELPHLALPGFCCSILYTVYFGWLFQPTFWCCSQVGENNLWYSAGVLFYYCIVYGAPACLNLTTSQFSHTWMCQPSKKN